MKVDVDITVEALQTIVTKICPAIKSEGYDIISVEGKDGAYSILFQTRPSSRERNRASGSDHVSSFAVKAGSNSGSETIAPVCAINEEPILDSGLQRSSR